MQTARSSWALSIGVNRGHDDGEPDYMPGFDIIEEWDSIESYKEYNLSNK